MSCDTPQVRPLTQEEYLLWDTFVKESPQGSIFSKSDYLQILADASDSRLCIIGCFLDGSLIGGCPLLEKSRRFYGTYAISSGPGTPFSGFIYRKTDRTTVRMNENMYNACIHALCDYVQRNNYTSISVYNSPDLLDIRPFLRYGWKERVSYTYYINLNNFSINYFSSSVKKSIKLAQQKNLLYQKSDDTHSYYDLLTDVFQQHGAQPPFNEEYYKKMLKILKSTNSGDLRIVTDQSGQLLASYLWVWDNKRAYAWSGGAVLSAEYRGGMANKYMFYCFLEELREMGFKEANIMHANTPRLTSFATGFNPVLVPYYIVEYDCRLVSCLRNLKKIINMW